MSDPSQNPQHHVTNQTVQDNAHVGVMAGRDIIGNVTINHGPDRTLLLNACLDTNYSFFQSRLDRFVGREQELADIRQRIEELLPTGGYVTIMGQAGQGKSCVIAKLVHVHLLQVAAAQGKELTSNPSFNQLTSKVGHEQLIFHAIPLDPGADYQVSLLRNLIARLCLKHGLPEIYAASDSRPALRDYFATALRDIAQQGKQELIYIDGLDQILPDSDGKRDLSFLPTNPPAGIVFVLGTRPDDTLQPLELRKPREPYLLPALSQGDFELILQRYQVNLATVNIQRFYDAMDHNALYLDLVAQELHVDHNLLDSKTIEGLIARLSANPSKIFSLTIERLSQHERYWDKALKPLLAYLLVAKSPLSADALRKLIQSDQNTIQTGLRLLGGLLTTTSDQRYTLYHLKLRDYLKEHFFADDEQREFHQCLADWAYEGKGGLEAIWQDQKDKQEQERRVYAREHLIAQLADAQDYDRLWELIDTGDYGRAKLRFDPSTRSYALDLDYARQAIMLAGETLEEQLQLLPRFWKYSLLRTRLASRADAYPDEIYRALAKQSRVQELIGLLELLNDQQRKIRLFLELSEYISDRDNLVQQMRNRALQLWHDLTCEEHESYLYGWFNPNLGIKSAPIRLIPLLIEPYLAKNSTHDRHNHSFYRHYYQLADKAKEQEAVEIEQTQTSTSQISNLGRRNRTTDVIVKTLVETGQLEQAQTIATQISDPNQRSMAVSLIVETLLVRGEIEQAQNFASQISDPDQRSRAVGTIVMVLLARGETKRAQDFASQFSNLDRQNRTTSTIMKALIGAGQIEQAQILAFQFAQPHIRGWAVGSIVEGLLVRGEFGQAQIVATQISDPNQRSKTVGVIVEALLVRGEIEQAQAFVSQVSRLGEQSWRVDVIVKTLVKALLVRWEIEQVLTLISQINHPYWRSRAEAVIVEVLAQTGQLDQAQDLVSQISDLDQRSRAEAAIVKVLAQTGQLDQAQDLVSQISDLDQRSRAEAAIVETLAKKEEIKPAQALAFKIINSLQRSRAEAAIVETLAKKGEIKQAKHLASQISDLSQRSRAEAVIVEALVKEGEIEQAQRLASQISLSFEQSRAVQAIATVLERTELVQQHLSIIDQISDKDLRSQSAELVVKVLLERGEIKQAQQLAAQINRPDQRGRAEQAIVEALVKAGQIEQAQQLAAQINHPDQRGRAEQAIVRALVKAGQIEVAQQLASQISDPSKRNWAEQAIVWALVKAGQIEQAQQLAAQINHPDQRGRAEQEIVDALSKRKLWAETIISIEHFWFQSRTYDELCSKFSFIKPLIITFPELGMQLAECFDWVESALA